ncbi:hypothetical protein [Tritonibacter mobilis]|uniref:hypothetical protein n=1 Tax=Tritonibacter mobilis TaxID=379347 RepID=UPI0008069DC2|nr:hypothetical protein [Tritonibacter mobilis]
MTLIFKHINNAGTNKNGTQGPNAKTAKEIWPTVAALVGLPADLPTLVRAGTHATHTNIFIGKDPAPAVEYWQTEGVVVTLREIPGGGHGARDVDRLVVYMTTGQAMAEAIREEGLANVPWGHKSLKLVKVLASDAVLLAQEG